MIMGHAGTTVLSFAAVPGHFRKVPPEEDNDGLHFLFGGSQQNTKHHIEPMSTIVHIQCIVCLFFFIVLFYHPQYPTFIWRCCLKLLNLEKKLMKSCEQKVL